jgi:phosphoribosyl-ATP pyrophosphohydrolase
MTHGGRARTWPWGIHSALRHGIGWSLVRATTPEEPAMSLDALEQVLRARRADAPSGSYSVTLVTDPEHASRKIMEEAYEVCVELLRPAVDRPRVTEEAADLLFHLLAGLVAVDVDLADVLAELEARRGSDTSRTRPQTAKR